jgi:hypothetical protein
MPSGLPLRAALKQGALVTAANWPAVLVEFSLWALYELALGVPVLGGAFMVTVLLGLDIGTLFGQGLQDTTDLIVGSLSAAPIALAAFLAALGLVAGGGLILIGMVRAGTLAILVAGERAAADLHRAPLHVAGVRRAAAWTLPAVYEGVRRYGRRAAWLTAGLCLAYLAIGICTLAAIALGFDLAADPAWTGAWRVFVVLSTAAGVVAVSVVNLLSDLARVVVVTDDCRLSEAPARVWKFMVGDARQVIGIFAVTSGILALAAAAWLVATANVAVIGFVPVVGLLVAPLQAAAWIVRGLLFQFMGLATLSAYQTQYRRFRRPGTRPVAASFGSQPA